MQGYIYSLEGQDFIAIKLNKNDDLYRDMRDGDPAFVGKMIATLREFFPESFKGGMNEVTAFGTEDGGCLIVICSMATPRPLKVKARAKALEYYKSPDTDWFDIEKRDLEELLKSYNEDLEEDDSDEEEIDEKEVFQNNERIASQSTPAKVWYLLPNLGMLLDMPLKTGCIYEKNGSYYLYTSEWIAGEFFDIAKYPGECDLICDLSKLEQKLPAD